MLIRFPLTIEDRPKPKRRPVEPWRNVVLAGLAVLLALLFMVYVVIPLLEVAE